MLKFVKNSENNCKCSFCQETASYSLENTLNENTTNSFNLCDKCGRIVKEILNDKNEALFLDLTTLDELQNYNSVKYILLRGLGTSQYLTLETLFGRTQKELEEIVKASNNSF